MKSVRLGQEVGTAQTPGPGFDSEELSQPSQPFSSKGKEVIDKGGEGPGGAAEGRREKGSENGRDGWDTSDSPAGPAGGEADKYESTERLAETAENALPYTYNDKGVTYEEGEGFD